MSGLSTPVALLLLAFPALAGADTICRDAHTDSIGTVARGVTAPAFLITTDCAQDSLRRLPQLAIRWSADSSATHGEPAAEIPSLKEPPPSSLAIQTKRQAPVAVLFDLDSARLMPAAEALLDGVGEGTKVSVAGHACELGSPSRNLLLSQQRAETVAAYLRGRGVLVETVEKKGECCPVSDRLELNRRVEVKPTQKEE